MGPHDDSSMTRAWRWLASAGEVLSPCHAPFLVPLRGRRKGGGCVPLWSHSREPRVSSRPRPWVPCFPIQPASLQTLITPRLAVSGRPLWHSRRTSVATISSTRSLPKAACQSSPSATHLDGRTGGGDMLETPSARLFCFKFGAPGRRLLAAADSMESEI